MVQSAPYSHLVPNGAPLVEFVADAILRIRTQNVMTRILVVAPSLYSAFYLRRAVTENLCSDDGGGLFNVEFTRIEEVADTIFDAVSGQTDQPSMTRLIASELIHNAIAELVTPGPLSNHLNNDSTLEAVQNTLRELELLDIGAESALDQLARGSRQGLYPQLLELQRRYAAPASNYLTRENKAALAAAAVTKDPSTSTAIFGPHLIVLRAPLAPDAYTRLWDALEQLDAAIPARIDSEPKTVDQTPNHRTETNFYSTLSAADEPRALIRNIVADARAGVRLGEMAVFYPTVDYASRVKDALDAANIKNCGPSTETLAETPSGKFVALFLTMLANDMRRDAFTSWTASAPVIDPSDGSRVSAVEWEIISRNSNIVRFDANTDWQRSLRRYANRMSNRAQRADSDTDDEKSVDPETFRNAANAATQLRWFVAELASRIDVDQSRPWTEWVDWMEGIIAVYHSHHNVYDDRERIGRTRVASELSQLRELDQITNDDVGFDRFNRTVQRLLRARTGGSSGWGSALLVAPLSAGIGTAFKSVHVLGMSEGVLPGPSRSDPLLSDDLRRELDPDGHWLTTRRDKLELQHREFNLALDCATTRRMYWNKALLGATNESYPSPWFVDELLKTHNETNVPVKDLMDPHTDWVESVTSLSDIGTTGNEAFSDYEHRLQNVATRSNDESGLREFLAAPGNYPILLGDQTLKSRNSSVFGPYDGNVNLELNGSRPSLHLSASALQDYATCPYRYFITNELHVDARIDPDESLELSSLDKGILVHSILERFFEEFRPEDAENGLRRLRDVAHGVFEHFLRDEYVGYPSIFELEKVRLLSQLEEWHRDYMIVMSGYDGMVKPEVSFGYEADDLGHMQTTDGGTLRLRGKIDLIAVSPARDYAQVLDFKSGSTRSYSDIEQDVTASGTKLQLPIYALIAREILGPATEISAAYWFVFERGNKRLRPEHKVSIEQAQEKFDPVLDTIVGGIRAGNFPARPGNRDSWGDGPPWKNCKYCDYSDACHSDRLILWARKKSSPPLSGYLTLVEGGAE